MIPKIVVVWLVYAGLAAGVTAGGYFAWQHFVANPYRAQGRAQLQPALNATVLQLKADIAAFKEVEGYMTALVDDSKRIAAAGVEADKANDKRRGREKARIIYLNDIIPKGATECERTSDAIARTLR